MMTPDRPTSLLPPLRVLGPDLLRVTPLQRARLLAVPFAWCGAYFLLASFGYWPLAVLALVALSFVTYGSVSHDLVHHALGLSRRANDRFLCLIELLAVRSGHAYRAAHLHHHARFPHPDDIEATAAGKSWAGALLEGPTFQVRLWRWAVRNAQQDRRWVIGEGAACVTLVGGAVALTPFTLIPLVYVGLMVAGSWVIPLVTAYLPHDPHGATELSRTRAYRGVVASVLALEHLYHLEHHLYPAVPHVNWLTLATRLDPFLTRAGVRPVKFWF